MVYHSPSRRRVVTYKPFVAFLLIASFGILFAGCKGPEAVGENKDYVFTQQDLDRAHELADTAAKAAGSGSAQSSMPYLEAIDSGSGSAVHSDIVLNLSMVDAYKSVRVGASNAASGRNTYRVTNEFVNVREKTAISSGLVARLTYGDSLEVLSFPNAAWAEVQLSSGKKGFVSLQYIAKIVSDDQMNVEKRNYAGQFFVHYAFVNVRKEAKQQSEKVGVIPGQTILRPTDIKDGWAAVSYNGMNGYVAMSYLEPFLPSFLVRQNDYRLPVLTYTLSPGQEDETLQALATHVAKLKAAGVSFMTFSRFRDLLLAQQKNDVRIKPNSVIVAVEGLTVDNALKVSDALNAAGIDATLFIQTSNVSLAGITEKMLLRLIANGFDIESATHTGDDLRALTNAQVTLELRQSRKILEDLTHRSVSAIAYPQGGTNDRVMQIAADAGYLLGLSSGSDPHFTRDQLLAIPGIDIFPTMTAEDVVKMVVGK